MPSSLAPSLKTKRLLPLPPSTFAIWANDPTTPATLPASVPVMLTVRLAVKGDRSRPLLPLLLPPERRPWSKAPVKKLKPLLALLPITFWIERNDTTPATLPASVPVMLTVRLAVEADRSRVLLLPPVRVPDRLAPLLKLKTLVPLPPVRLA